MVSSRQSAFAVKDWLLGTQAAPACEAGAFILGRLMTVDRSQCFGRSATELYRREWLENSSPNRILFTTTILLLAVSPS